MKTLRFGTTTLVAAVALFGVLVGTAAPQAFADSASPDHGRGHRAPSCRDGAGTIAGTVTDASGAPVEGARVNASRSKGGALTAADGTYELTGQCLGATIVQAAKPEVGAGAYDADDNGKADKVILTADTPSAGGIDITLAPRPERPAPPAACEGGTGSIAGTVTDSDGNAVEGAEVKAHGAGNRGSDATSAADGTYAITGLCAGNLGVEAHKRDVGQGAYDADGDGKPDPVTLTADAPSASGIDIVLKVRPHGGRGPRGPRGG